MDYRNNVVYNWGFKTAYGSGHHAEINMVNNYYKPGPASQHHRLLDVAEDGTGRYYVAGNVMAGGDAVKSGNQGAITDLRNVHPVWSALPFRVNRFMKMHLLLLISGFWNPWDVVSRRIAMIVRSYVK